MSEIDELLVLRLGLLGILFLFILIVAATLRAPVVRGAPAGGTARRRQYEPRLIVIDPRTTGLARGDEFMLGGELTIGRDETNGIVLDDVSVSRRHAIIRVSRQGTEIADLQSSNGTMVNDKTVGSRSRPLRDGDYVRFGAVVLQYHA